MRRTLGGWGGEVLGEAYPRARRMRESVGRAAPWMVSVAEHLATPPTQRAAQNVQLGTLGKGGNSMLTRSNPEALVQAIQERAVPLHQVKDLDKLVERLAKARIVMLGEASHGTQEFYSWRRLISQWLMARHGFKFIAVEGDWPEIQKINHYIHHEAPSKDARQVLEGFHRWPTWMWANTETIRLAQWMHSHNSVVPRSQRVGIHGLDIYSLYDSIDAVIGYLEKINPILARRARVHYACFDPSHRDEIAYARSTLEFPQGCEAEAVQTLQELLDLRFRLGDESAVGEDLFDAEQNAKIIKDAEHYYRVMIRDHNESWNIRDRHMLDTLDALLEHYGPDSKTIVWAHNTHVGDHRATDMIDDGLVNIGGLARKRYGEDAVALVGFGTYEGSVVASHAWDGPFEIMKVPPARKDSLEDSMHQVALSNSSPNFFMLLDQEARSGILGQRSRQRAIGVVYDPAHERWGNYVPTSLAHRYDAFIHLDQTSAVEPLILPFGKKEFPQTYPVGQ